MCLVAIILYAAYLQPDMRSNVMQGRETWEKDSRTEKLSTGGCPWPAVNDRALETPCTTASKSVNLLPLIYSIYEGLSRNMCVMSVLF